MTEAAKPVTTHALVAMKAEGRRIVMLTCYDALFARLLDASGVDLLLVGDSVNQVLAGEDTTLSARLDQMIYHTKIVRRGAQRAMVICDLPFLTYQVSREEAIRNAGRAMAETGCHAVKLEGGAQMAPTVRALVEVGIPVMGHIGLTPQSVRAGRISGTGPRPSDGAAAETRRTRAGSRRGVRDRAGAGAGAAGRRDHQIVDDPDHRHRRRAEL
jgi:3-methyl-2-oxobutanoate hydroxymethyltransferase